MNFDSDFLVLTVSWPSQSIFNSDTTDCILTGFIKRKKEKEKLSPCRHGFQFYHLKFAGPKWTTRKAVCQYQAHPLYFISANCQKLRLLCHSQARIVSFLASFLLAPGLDSQSGSREWKQSATSGQAFVCPCESSFLCHSNQYSASPQETVLW